MRLRRVVSDRLWTGFTVVALGLAIVPLISIVLDIVVKGISVINLDFFTQLPPLADAAGGGMGNAIQGTLLLVALSCVIGLPIGLFSGVYVSEYGATNRYGSTVRFLGDVLAGIPSIVTGVLAYTLIVLTFKGFSLLAGGVALGTMMIPIVSNTTAEALKSVPNSIREASMALGIRKWRTSLLIMANAKKAIATASLLAIARITGETAPLILTAGISTLWFSGFNQPVASLTYYIYYFANSGYQNWQNMAWGAALFLIVIVLGINAAVRLITRGKKAYA
ncbi:MAG TPA: phosphate ABC transporter permease PstA [Nitrososphaerales archaeon]|nr:phosphate ABC transporter permease PstA [Nitrososphaerales archaeon]